jgi:transposase
MSADTIVGELSSGRVVNRRRKWSDEAKRRIVAESYAGDASIAAVAMRNGVSPGLLFNWRRQLGAIGMGLPAPVSSAAPLLTPIEVAGDYGLAKAQTGVGVIEIELAGARVCVDDAVSEMALVRVFSALRATQ